MAKLIDFPHGYRRQLVYANLSVQLVFTDLQLPLKREFYKKYNVINLNFPKRQD